MYRYFNNQRIGCAINGRANHVITELDKDRSNDVDNFCDFTVKTVTRDFPVHKCVLGVMSDYFKTFKSNMKERYENHATLDGLSAETFDLVLQFLYTNEFEVNVDNVQELLEAAEYLQITSLKNHCSKIMLENLSVENVLSTWHYAKVYTLQDLLGECKVKIRENFQNLLKENDFQNIDSKFVCDFFSLCDNTTSDGAKFKAIMEWIDTDRTTRSKLFGKLVTLIDFDKLPQAFLIRNILNNELLCDGTDCSRMLLKLLKTFVHENEREKGDYKRVLLASIEESMIHNFDVKRRAIVKSTAVVKRGDTIKFGFACVKNVVYMLGGRKCFAYTSNAQVIALHFIDEYGDFLCYLMPNMYDKRYSFGCATLGNEIYVAGGKAHQSQWLSSVESFDIGNRTWTRRESMQYKRAYFGLVTCDRLLYAIGGYMGMISSKIHNSMEIFDGITWKFGENMQNQRTELAAVCLDREIYAIGGKTTEYSYTSTVEMFSNGMWSFVASMTTKRAGHGACVIQGKIYVFGGENEEGPVTSVEEYDPALDKWEIITILQRNLIGTSLIAVA